MYLSRVMLDVRRRETIRALASPQVMHGAVESCFPWDVTSGEARKRVLWRTDYVGDRCYLLLLSEEQPNLAHLAEQFGYPDLHPQGETKPYAPLLERLQNGQRWQFRLRANPVHSSPRETHERTGRGKVYAHVTREQQLLWLLNRAEKLGFALEPQEFTVTHTEWKRFHKSSHDDQQVTLRTATYEGVLTVTDAERFRQTLTSGIGRAKAYGCGLMTIIPYRG
jgi:CRISPR system Cascade subunit CasE